MPPCKSGLQGFQPPGVSLSITQYQRVAAPWVIISCYHGIVDNQEIHEMESYRLEGQGDGNDDSEEMGVQG